jgi:hypothetical protein
MPKAHGKFYNMFVKKSRHTYHFFVYYFIQRSSVGWLYFLKTSVIMACGHKRKEEISMSMKLVKRVPTGDEIKELYPLSN